MRFTGYFTATVLAVAAVSVLAVHEARAQSFSDFDCDFDSLADGFDGDYSCDYSVDIDGSFDMSCEFSRSDDATEVEASGAMDASCDVEENGDYECDFSSDYDYESPTQPSISRSLDCDTVGTGEILMVSCGNAIPEEEIRDLLGTIEIVCGVPQDFQLILEKLIDAGASETIKALTNDMRGSLKSVSGLKGKGKVRRLLKRVAKLTKRGRADAAKSKVAKAQALVDARAASLPPEEMGKLCASSLFCF